MKTEQQVKIDNVEIEHIALLAKEHALRLEFHVACDPLCEDGRRLLQATPEFLRKLACRISELKS